MLVTHDQEPTVGEAHLGSVVRSDAVSLRRINPGPRMSQAVVYNGVVSTAGVVADDTSLDVAGQTAQILAKIETLLVEAGSDKTKLIKANIWLSDIGTFAQMNAVWDTWIVPGHTPARATVEAKLASPEYKVEIMIDAAT
jgi:enamine deaminase RidA (YjgF/YER057c/UK114 family)